MLYILYLQLVKVFTEIIPRNFGLRKLYDNNAVTMIMV